MGKKPALNPKAHTEYLKMPKLKSTAGFSLIEVLVTLLMVGISLLGMGILQTKSIQYTHDSAQRNIAALLANDLVELIRAKPDGLPASSSFYKAKGTELARDANLSCTPLPNDTQKQKTCWAKSVEQLLLSTNADQKTTNDALFKDEFYICQANTNGCGSGDFIEIQLAWPVKQGECLNNNTEDTVCRYKLQTRILAEQP